jgi:hypothetical protein
MPEMYVDGDVKRLPLGITRRCMPGIVDNPKFCPTLSKVVEPDVLLPGVASRTTVPSEKLWL